MRSPTPEHTDDDEYEDSEEESMEQAPMEHHSTRVMEAIRERMCYLYKRFNAEKMDIIPHLLQKYRGQEWELLCAMHQKYEAPIGFFKTAGDPLEELINDYHRRMKRGGEVVRSFQTALEVVEDEEELHDEAQRLGDVQRSGVDIRTADTDDELPVEEVQVTGCPRVNDPDHWSHSTLMSKKNRHLFSKILDRTDVVLPSAKDFPVDGLIDYLEHMEFPMTSLCAPVKMELPPVASPGQWWRLDVKTRLLNDMVSWEQSHGTAEWTFALHGTTIRAASQILKNGFEPARNETRGVSGVYVEGMARKECTIRYATHTQDMPLPLHYVAEVVLEVMVDKRFTKTVHKQWVQPDPRSVAVVAVLVHIVDVPAVYRENFVGWLRVASRNIQDIQELL